MRPRLFAGIWFAVAGAIPGFLYGIGSYRDIWFLSLCPALIAGIWGSFWWGASILTDEQMTNGRAVLRGVWIAFLSWITFALVWAIGFGWHDPVEGPNFMGLFWLIFLFGSIWMGWLMALVGGVAGWLLYRVARRLRPRLRYGDLPVMAAEWARPQTEEPIKTERSET
ncbi:MAG TPA: hypothetical protein VFB38_08780 [Chthonomonadaceae bacterium]|nr:hypothetical protein [Chthonomonadaceae bacterium]